MGCDFYKIIDASNGIVIASHVALEHACLLVKMLMQEYYNEPELAYTIQRECKEE